MKCSICQILLVFVSLITGCTNTEAPSSYRDSISETSPVAESIPETSSITERDPETTSHFVDDPATTNDEFNDQPLGQFGTVTLCVRNPRNGNRYALDADVNGQEVSTIYFPKGGNIDFVGCELESGLTGNCAGDDGKDWEFEGECQ